MKFKLEETCWMMLLLRKATRQARERCTKKDTFTVSDSCWSRVQPLAYRDKSESDSVEKQHNSFEREEERSKRHRGDDE